MAYLLDALEWRQARQWLITSGVIPPTHRVTKPDVDLVDFARSLRDGVFLCSLLNKIKPGCLPESEWTPKPLMQYSYLRNITAFLSACRSKFRLKEADLFNESDLYDVDNFKKVMNLLSKLSHTPEALSLGWVPFPREETRDYYNQVNNDDIYASLQDIAMTSERLYANVEDLYAEVPREEDPYGYGDESIYDSICYYQAPPVKTTDADEKKKYVLQEIYETERSFLSVLELVSQDFYLSLKDHIPQEDTELLFSIARSLYPVHSALLEGFERCVEPKHDATKTDITKYFLDQQQGLLQYGLYAARLPLAVDKAKALATRGETVRILQQCQERSNQRFLLSDLLNVPIQRFLKYPLLIKELHKCAKKCAMPSHSEVTNLETVLGVLEDVAGYINATKGDYESMKVIEEVEESFVDYRGPSLLTYGRYHLDGELRMKPVEASGQPKNKQWAFLFDKAMLLCKKVPKLFDVRYSPKQVFLVSEMRVELSQSAHRGKFSYAFRLFVQGQGEFVAHAKTEELRSQWVDAINTAKEVVVPREAKKGHHSVELQTFEQPYYCDACHKLLQGCYFQGYSCTGCKHVAHRDCLKDLERCSSVQPHLPPTHRRPPHPPLAPSLSADPEPWSPGAGGGRRPHRNATIAVPNGLDKRGQIYVAKQRYDTIGSRSNRVLSFERGEELEVLNPSVSAEWWEAISLRTGNRGEVPASFLIKKSSVSSADDLLDPPDQLFSRKSIPGPSPSYSFEGDGAPSTSPDGRRRGDPMEERLRSYPWYLGKKSRIEAEQALHRTRDGVFLIRESDMRPGEYAIALKWNKMPKHIKISKHPDTRKFYVSDVCEFLSVEELVAYYQQNSLGSSFPGVDTTLRYPYKELLEGTGTRPRSTSNPPGPPLLPSAPHPVHVASPSLPAGDRWADVLFTFVAEFPDELTIEKHDCVRVLDKDTNKLGWWYGECNGKTGLFPSNYVREITG